MSLPRYLTDSACKTCPMRRSTLATIILTTGIALLTIAIVVSLAKEAEHERKQAGHIHSLQEWQRAVEARTRDRWTKSQHDEWTRRLMEANPSLVIPTEAGASPSQQ